VTALAPTLQLFFTERLARQRQASPQTVLSYRNTFRLLLRFLQQRTGKAPSHLDWEDLSAEAISAFLDHLEAGRGNSARSRNARLAALRSLFRYAALRHPEHAQLIQQVLAIPQKRFDRAPVSFLTPPKQARCWPLPTSAAGKAAATVPCSTWPRKQACGYPS
jgi:site-specific recombinase XerD